MNQSVAQSKASAHATNSTQVKIIPLTTAEKRSLIAQVVEEIPVRWDIDDHWWLEVRLRKDATGHFESGEPALNVQYISMCCTINNVEIRAHAGRQDN